MIQNTSNIKRFLTLHNLILGFGLICLAISLFFGTKVVDEFREQRANSIIESVESTLQKKELIVQDVFKEASKNSPLINYQSKLTLLDKCTKNNIYLYVYVEENLLFWTHNEVLPQDFVVGNGKTHRISNGYYHQINIASNDTVLVALIPIQKAYRFENNYLKNKFELINKSSIQECITVTQKGYNNSIDIHTLNKAVAFSVSIDTSVIKLPLISYTFILSFLLLFVWINLKLFIFIREGNFNSFLAFFLISIFLALIIWMLRIPKEFFEFDIFYPSLFGSFITFLEFFPSSTIQIPIRSLGDLLILSLLIGWIVLLFRATLKIIPKPKILSSNIQSLFLLLASLLLLYGVVIQKIVKSFILDSSISFDLTNIFGLNYYSLIGLIIISIHLAVFVFFLTIIVNLSAHCIKTYRIFTFGLFALAIGLSLTEHSYSALLFYFLSLILIFKLTTKDSENKTLIYLAGFSLCSALYVSTLFNYYEEQHQLEKQKVTAFNLISQRDAVAEYLFPDLVKNLQKDAYLRNYYLAPILSQSALSNRLTELYFAGYFNKYDVSFYTYNDSGIPYLGNYETPIKQFDEWVSKYNPSLVIDEPVQLFYFDRVSGLPTYFTPLTIYNGVIPIGKLVLSLKQKAFYEEGLYPELVLSDDLQKYKLLDKYSFSIYDNGTLITQRGDYSYPEQIIPDFIQNKKSFTTDYNDYRHLIYKSGENQIIILSQPQQKFIYSLAIISFLLLFFIFTSLMVLWVRYLYRQLSIQYLNKRRIYWEFPKWQNISFRYKIFVTIILAVTLTFISIGFSSIRFFERTYKQEEKNRLMNLTKTIVTKVEQLVESGLNYIPNENNDELQALIKSLSNTYQTDINIYNQRGTLVTSSQMLLYDKGIIERKININALNNFIHEHLTQFLLKEQIGLLQFTSTYSAIHNNKNQVVGYINLPVFTKDKDLSNTISSFVVSLVNVYILLFIGLLLLSILVSNAITYPLSIISNHLRKAQINLTNDVIFWQSNDEIGKLVKEYNSMIIALEENARRLAESEREGAWKEMAKQVAHEIKNPLTPMKLHIQQLQRAWKENPEKLDVLIPKVTDIIVKQIDTLSGIATEFSNFAKMTQHNPELLNLNDIIQQAIELFRNSHTVEVNYYTYAKDIQVLVDRDNFGRVFNNLIKNAIQAIGDKPNGSVKISLQKTANKEVTVSIQDNGMGIPEDIIHKIFVPNFSTKNSGMGLGLAIVKNIVEASNGKIWFTTHYQKGTTFFVSLPLS